LGVLGWVGWVGCCGVQLGFGYKTGRSCWRAGVGPQTSNFGKPPLFISRPNDLRAVQTVERVEKRLLLRLPQGRGRRREWPRPEC
jgi:hypothetical protein